MALAVWGTGTVRQRERFAFVLWRSSSRMVPDRRAPSVPFYTCLSQLHSKLMLTEEQNNSVREGCYDIKSASQKTKQIKNQGRPEPVHFPQSWFWVLVYRLLPKRCRSYGWNPDREGSHEKKKNATKTLFLTCSFCRKELLMSEFCPRVRSRYSFFTFDRVQPVANLSHMVILTPLFTHVSEVFVNVFRKPVGCWQKCDGRNKMLNYEVQLTTLLQ